MQKIRMEANKFFQLTLQRTSNILTNSNRSHTGRQNCCQNSRYLTSKPAHNWPPFQHNLWRPPSPPFQCCLSAYRFDDVGLTPVYNMLSFLVSEWPEQDYTVLPTSSNIVFGGEGGMFINKVYFRCLSHLFRTGLSPIYREVVHFGA